MMALVILKSNSFHIKRIEERLRITTPLKINFNYSAKYVDTQNQYEWLVCVDEDEEILNRIEKVEYLLDSDLIVSTHSADRFAMMSLGGNKVKLTMTVIFKNGTKLKISHQLDNADNALC